MPRHLEYFWVSRPRRVPEERVLASRRRMPRRTACPLKRSVECQLKRLHIVWVCLQTLALLPHLTRLHIGWVQTQRGKGLKEAEPAAAYLTYWVGADLAEAELAGAYRVPAEEKRRAPAEETAYCVGVLARTGILAECRRCPVHASASLPAGRYASRETGAGASLEDRATANGNG
jgi:hypothetical protein